MNGYTRAIQRIKNLCPEKTDWQNLPYQLQFYPVLKACYKDIHHITKINPLLPYGGFTEYPKHLIHNKLPQEYFPRTVDLLSTTAPTIEEIEQIMKEKTITYPIMMKADRGERGAGITYIPSREKLHIRHETVK